MWVPPMTPETSPEKPPYFQRCLVRHDLTVPGAKGWVFNRGFFEDPEPNKKSDSYDTLNQWCIYLCIYSNFTMHLIIPCSIQLPK